jgi:segregation and condensation protein B
MNDPRSITDKSMIETMLLTSTTPMSAAMIANRLGYSPDLRRIIDELNNDYDGRGLMIVETSPGHWAARTQPEASDLCRSFLPRQIRMSKAGFETLAVIAYFQPVTRSEIERVRGVSLSSGTIEALIYSGFVQLGPRRMSPGNPMTFKTTDYFLQHFNLASLDSLPDKDSLQTEGLLSAEKGIAASGLTGVDA